MKKSLRRLLVCSLTLISGFSIASEPISLGWDDLVPEHEQEMIKQASIQFTLDHSGEAPMQNTLGSFREELAGKEVQIPGFVIPLEGDDEKTTQFLLVPYYGACIHVPPPPTNQIIVVNAPKGVANQGLWDVVSVTGTLNIENTSTEFADAGYALSDIQVEPYE